MVFFISIFSRIQISIVYDICMLGESFIILRMLHYVHYFLVKKISSGTIHLWDLRNDHNEQLLPEPNSSIAHVDVDEEGTMLAAINNKGVCYTWNLISGVVSNESTRLNPKIKVSFILESNNCGAAHSC